jgi:hypothetical protein
VTDGNSYVCSLYNDAEFAAVPVFSAHTTDSTHTITITAATGQSFQDNVGVRTNPLVYDQTKGAGIRTAVTGNVGIKTVDAYITISRLQIKTTGTGSSEALITYSNNTLKDLILEVTTAGSESVIQANNATGAKFINIAAIQHGSGKGFNLTSGTPLVLGCSIVKPADVSASAEGITMSSGSSAILQSTAIFGFSTATSGSWDATASKYNATNLSSGLPGTNQKYNVTWSTATPFTSAATVSMNLIAITSTDLAPNGFLDATNGPKDIGGYTRQAAPTIGAWELTYTPTANIRRVRWYGGSL